MQDNVLKMNPAAAKTETPAPAPVVGDARGRDIAAPEMTVTLNGTRYVLKFNNKAARVCEDVYAEQYGRDVGYYAILKEASRFMHRALMALYYGALIGGGADVSWAQFDEQFTISEIEGVSEALMRAIAQALPEHDAKNALSTPRKKKGIFRGRG